MAAIRNILNVYEKADSAKKVDIIIRYYPNLLGIVDSYTEGLRYMIENEKAYNRSKSRGDLGVRVQTSGKHSDITADTAISNVITRDAIIACDFSHILKKCKHITIQTNSCIWKGGMSLCKRFILRKSTWPVWIMCQDGWMCFIM